MDKKSYQIAQKGLNHKPRNRLNGTLAIAALSLFVGGLWLFFLESWQANVVGGFLLVVAMHYSYLIVHECSHGSFFSKKFTNILVGHIVSIPAILPFFARLYEHTLHHTWVGHLENDGTTKRAIKNLKSRNYLLKFIIAFCWRAYLPILSFNEHVMLWSYPVTAKNERMPKRLQALFSAVVVAVPWMLLTYVMGMVLWLKLIPVLLSYFFLIELLNLPHHFGTIHYRGKRKPLWEHHDVTRSCPMNPLIAKVFLLNFNLHIEHHFFPALPWHELPKAEGQVKAMLGGRYQVAQEWPWTIENRRVSINVHLTEHLKAAQVL